MADILARLALVAVIEQRALEDEGVRRVDDHQPLDAGGVLQRRHPGDRAAPIVADQREAVDAVVIGEREQVGDDPVGRVLFDALRLGRAGIAALVGREDEMVAREIRHDAAPRPVRFGKAVQQNDGRLVARTGDLHVQVDAGGECDAVEGVGHGMLR